MTLRPSPRAIIASVCKEWQIDMDEILGNGRGPLCEPRYAAIYLMCRVFGHTQRLALRSLGRGYSTASNTISTAKALMASNAFFALRVGRLEEDIKRHAPFEADPPAPIRFRSSSLPDMIGDKSPDPNRDRILRLRARRWSLKSISRYLDLPESVVAPVIGVRQGDGAS